MLFIFIMLLQGGTINIIIYTTVEYEVGLCKKRKEDTLIRVWLLSYSAVCKLMTLKFALLHLGTLDI